MELFKHSELTYSRSNNHYSRRYHSPLSRLKSVKNAVDKFDELGLIEHDKKQAGTQNDGQQSSMIATDELCHIVGSIVTLEQLPPEMPRELVVLRDHNKKLKQYEDSVRTRKMRKKLTAHGEAVMSSGITGCVLTPMTRIFNEQWRWGGRGYALWQNVPKKEREQFTIGGEPMVELDFKSIHPSLLYAEKGLTVPDDCYDIKGYQRAHVKLAVVILMNANTLKKAVMALAADIEDMERKQRGLKLLTRKEQVPKCQVKLATALIKAIKNHHEVISENFHSGAGLRLQRIDSDIAEDVWWKMCKRGTVVLPVHDSFIVEASKANELEQVMVEASERIAKVALTVTR